MSTPRSVEPTQSLRGVVEVGGTSVLAQPHPGFTVQTWSGIHWSDDPTFNAQYQRIAESLREAGMPECDNKTE